MCWHGSTTRSVPRLDQSTKVSSPGIARAKRAVAWRRSLASAQSWPPRWLPKSATGGSSARGAILLPGSGWCPSSNYWSADTQRWLRLHSPTRWRGWPGPSWSVVRDTRSRSCCWQRENVSRSIGNTNWRRHDDVMQTRSIRGSGEPVWVIASLNACLRLGPDPRRALWPAATPVAQTGRTHDRTRPMLQQHQKVLDKAAPSTHDTKRTSSLLLMITKQPAIPTPEYILSGQALHRRVSN